MTNTNTASGAAMQLADQYAAAHAKWALEDLYGTSKSYTSKMLKELHALRSHLAAALASAAAPAEQPDTAYAALPVECDSPELCAVSQSCAGQFGTKRICASRGQAPAQAAPAYKDSTPDMHVGDSAFESWYSAYNPSHKSDKQRARDAYAAGMVNHKAQAIPGVQWQCGPQANGFTAAPAAGVVRVCPECDIAGCRHMRTAPAVAPAPAAQGDALARRLFDAGWKAAARFCDRDDVVADGVIGFGACPQFEAAFKAAIAAQQGDTK